MHTLTLKTRTPRVEALLAKRAEAKPGPANATKKPLGEKAAPALDWLRREFPLAFAPKNPRPLAIGIYHELVEWRAATTPEGVSKKRLNNALAYWTRQPAYLAALAAGGPRYGLDGSAVGIVSPEDRRSALERLSRGPGHPKTLQAGT